MLSLSDDAVINATIDKPSTAQFSDYSCACNSYLVESEDTHGFEYLAIVFSSNTNAFSNVTIDYIFDEDKKYFGTKRLCGSRTSKKFIK